MSLLDKESCECGRSELELFDLPGTQASIEETRYESYFPISSTDRGGPIEFRIMLGPDDYIAMDDCVLYLRVRILDENGEALPESEEIIVRYKDANNADAERRARQIPEKSVVFPVNNFIASAFRQVEVHLGSTPIGTSDNMYAYRGYIENLIASSKDNKKTQLDIGLFALDTGDFDEHDRTVALGEATNKGAERRYMKTKNSKAFECIGRIHNEMFLQDKLLLSKVPISVKLHRADDNFLLMSMNGNQQYRIQYEKAKLIVNVKKIASHVREAHEVKLNEMNAKYPVRRIEVKHFTRGSERSDISEPNLVNGTLPKRIFIGIVRTDSFNGDRHLNPYNFDHHNVNYVALRQNGQSVPREPFILDFNAGVAGEAYLAFLQAIHVWNSPHTNGVTRSAFVSGSTFYAFNLAQDESIGDNFNLVKEGNLSLDIRLKTPSRTSLTLICFMEYESIVEIDKDRNVYYNE